MSSSFIFNWQNLKGEYEKILDIGYKVIRCCDFANAKQRLEPLAPLTLVNRVDVDISPAKADRMRLLFDELGIKGTFFVRLHAPEYNPFSFENYRIFRSIIDSGHELGLHTETIDIATIWGEHPRDCYERDLTVFQAMFGIKSIGSAGHGGATGLNNLDFWQGHSPTDFGQSYEAYSEDESFGLFNNSSYVSDSEWTRWKSYQNGKLVEGDRRSPGEIAETRAPLIYMLIHPDSYFDRHIYDRER